VVGFEFDFKWLQLGNTAYRLKSPGELAQGAVKTTYIHKRLHSVTPKNSGFKTTPAGFSRAWPQSILLGRTRYWILAGFY
jgi:hypothetical protein